jgi:amino acid permease
VTLTVRTPRADSARLVITGLVALAVLAAIAAAIQWAGRHILLRIAASLKLLAFLLVFVLCCYLAFSDNGKKLGEWLVGLPRRVARWF